MANEGYGQTAPYGDGEYKGEGITADEREPAEKEITELLLEQFIRPRE